MVTKFRGAFITNNGHCKHSSCSLATLMAVDSSITSIITNHAANDGFYTSLISALECAIWQIWHRKMRARDAQGEQRLGQ